MKKFKFFSAFIAVVLILTTFSPLANTNATLYSKDEGEKLTVTFKMPEGHHYVQVVDDGHQIPYDILVDELTLEVEPGHILTETDVEPFTHHCSDEYTDCHRYCRVTMTGWDTNPVGVEVTQDMTFTAVMNEDVCKVTVTMSQGKYDTEWHVIDDYSSFDILVDKGYVLTEDDVERFETVYSALNPGSRPSYTITGFDIEPLGFEVNEDVAFTAIAEKLIYVEFYLPNDEGKYDYLFGCEISVIEGQPVAREELPEIESYVHDESVVVAYWDVTDEQLSAIYPNNEIGRSSFEIYGVLFKRGDANTDGKINTGDAVLVLKNVSNLEPLTENQLLTADMNADGEINTGDATAVLLAIVS
ncbi:MAG: hypothetical protein GX802_06265 [Clostridiales bacterium]|jgi:hypothetical protein|nr:hypothetical protein [Clostridiales bacterium]